MKSWIKAAAFTQHHLRSIVSQRTAVGWLVRNVGGFAHIGRRNVRALRAVHVDEVDNLVATAAVHVFDQHAADLALLLARVAAATDHARRVPPREAILVFVHEPARVDLVAKYKLHAVLVGVDGRLGALAALVQPRYVRNDGAGSRLGLVCHVGCVHGASPVAVDRLENDRHEHARARLVVDAERWRATESDAQHFVRLADA